MSTADFSVFFALLSLACWAATVIVLVLAVVTPARRDGEVALLFDDLQWADDAGLRLLAHLARNTRGRRMFLRTLLGLNWGGDANDGRSRGPAPIFITSRRRR